MVASTMTRHRLAYGLTYMLAMGCTGSNDTAEAEAGADQLRWYGLAAIAAVAIALGGGFLWYRRRLP